MCTLWQMCDISYLWELFKPQIQFMIDTTGAEDKDSKVPQEAAMSETIAMNVPLPKEMDKAVSLYASPKTDEKYKPKITACGSLS